MTRLKVIYIASFLVLAVLLVFFVVRPLMTGGEYSEVSEESVVRGEYEWVIQFDIMNREGRDMDYVVTWSSGEYMYSEDVSIKDGGIFTYRQHVYPHTVKEGRVTRSIYRQGESAPFEQTSYTVHFD